MSLATKTLNELLDENLEVIKLTRNPSTFRGRRVVINSSQGCIYCSWVQQSG